MSHDLNESTTPTQYPATVTVPDDADDATATAPGSPTPALEDVVQTLADRTHWLRDALQGALVGARRVEVGIAGGITTAGGAVVVGGKVLSIQGLAATITPATPARWLYLYVHDASGPSLAWSTTAPDSAGLFKTGDTSYRYLAALRIYDQGGGTWKASPLVRQGDAVLYTVPNGSIGALSGMLSRTITLDGTARLIDLSDVVPPTAKRVRARLRVAASAAAAGDYAVLAAQHGSIAGWTSSGGWRGVYLRFESPGSGGAGTESLETTATLELSNASEVWVEGDGSGSGAGYLLIDGWEE